MVAYDRNWTKNILNNNRHLLASVTKIDRLHADIKMMSTSLVIFSLLFLAIFSPMLALFSSRLSLHTGPHDRHQLQTLRELSIQNIKNKGSLFRSHSAKVGEDFDWPISDYLPIFMSIIKARKDVIPCLLLELENGVDSSEWKNCGLPQNAATVVC